jgi:hypothetical protein
MNKPRRTRWAAHVARTRDMHTEFRFANLNGRYHLEDLGVDERITLD